MFHPKRQVLLLLIVAANVPLCLMAWAFCTGRIYVGDWFQLAIGLGPGWAAADAIWGWESTSATTFWLLQTPTIIGINALVYGLIEILLFKLGKEIWRFSRAKDKH